MERKLYVCASLAAFIGSVTVVFIKVLVYVLIRTRGIELEEIGLMEILDSCYRGIWGDVRVDKRCLCDLRCKGLICPLGIGQVGIGVVVVLVHLNSEIWKSIFLDNLFKRRI